VRGPQGRRVRALGVLTRLKEREIDEVTRELSRLQQMIAALLADRGRLEAELAENAQVETLEGSFFLARYARSVRESIGRIDKRVAEIRPACDALETRMRALFTETKTYESLEVRIRAQAVRDRRRREEAEMEETHLARLAGPGRGPVSAA
jgi:flagellar export protein FliJ